MRQSIVARLVSQHGFRNFAFSALVVTASCSGDDNSPSGPAAHDAAELDARSPASDGGATGDVKLNPDTSATGDGNVTTDASAPGDADASAPGDADASATAVDADAGANDANASDVTVPTDANDAAVGALQDATDSGADALDESQLDAGFDAPLVIDLSGGTVLLLGSGASSVFTGEFHPGAPWIASTLPDTTDDPPAAALTSKSSGLGVIRSGGASGGEMRFTTWSPGSFGPLAAVASGVTTGAPALVASATRVELAYHGVDFKHYFASKAGTWSPNAQPIGVGAAQSIGPTAASLTMLGADSIVAFAGSTGVLTDRSLVGGVWQAAHTHDLGDAGDTVSVSPTIVAPTGGPELMIAFVRSPNQDVFFATRTAGTWAAPQAIAGAFTADRIALLALGGGDVILVFRAVDSHAYWARYSASAWSALKGFPWFDISVPSTPSIAAGVSGADAEIAFVDGDTGKAMHARLNGDTWSAPVAVGGVGLTAVGIASAR